MTLRSIPFTGLRRRLIVPALLVAVLPAAAAPARAQSIWDLAYDADPTVAPSGGNPYADAEVKPRRYQPGDIVTVIVNERGNARIQTRASADSETSVEASLDNFIRLSGNGLNRSLAPSLMRRGTPEIGFDSSIAIEREARNERRNQYSDRISCEVLYVQPNGNLTIEGKKIRHINGERETVAVTGIVDPRHITAETNTIASERLAQAQIVFTGEGDVSDWTILSWFHKLLAKIWPF